MYNCIFSSQSENRTTATCQRAGLTNGVTHMPLWILYLTLKEHVKQAGISRQQTSLKDMRLMES